MQVVGLASSDPASKATWIAGEAKKGGVREVEFHDDSPANVEAVAGIAKDLPGVKVDSVLAPLPREEHFEGPAKKQTFHSDHPVAAIVEVKHPAGQSQLSLPHTHAGGGWWGEQTAHFRQAYLAAHPASRYA